MIPRFLQRKKNVKTTSRDYWRKRFANDPEGWVAGGDRRWSEDVNYNSALEIMAKLTEVLKEYAAPFAGKTLLDAGCGVGHYTEMARKLGFAATGTDFCEEAVDHARQRYPENTYRVADLTNLELSHRFDVIISVNVLVALSDPADWEGALRRFASHLARGGLVVILERLRQPNETMDAAGHVAFRSLEEYREALKSSGLVVRHHGRVHLQVEDLWKDILVIGRSGGCRSLQ